MRKIGIGLGIACTAIMLALGAPAPATAQNTPVVLDNVSAWWDHLDCKMKIYAVNAVDYTASDPSDGQTSNILFDGVAAYSSTPNDHTREWCHMWTALGENQRRALTAATKLGAHTGTLKNGIVAAATERLFDTGNWWDTRSTRGRALAIGYDDDPDVDTLNAAALVVYASLPQRYAERADAAYAALKGEATAPPTPTPAVPLVGVLLLGAGLAARGAFLRRRR